MMLAHLLAVAGCYNPALRDCTVQCSSATDCTGGQQCSDGWCVMPGRASCDDRVVLDASDSPPDDGKPTDASDILLCRLGCTRGTCDAAGVCVIDCSASGSCSSFDVVCPPGVRCRVVCGDYACTHHVVCGYATSCEVQCSGVSSCSDEVRCSSGPCDVTCSGESSCRRRTKCATSCSCDVSCTGAGSCAEVAECPQMAKCQLGRGCSSLLAGCDLCAM